jgi:phosphatidylglycerophosphatase A
MKYMYSKKVCSYLSTLGRIGYLPMPGTAASLFTALVAYGFLYHHIPLLHKLIFLACVTGIATYSVQCALPLHTSKDPQEIVIDEVIGFLWAALFATTFFDYGVCFILFRFFDISKVMGLRSLEQLPGAYGIMADDIGAGLYSIIIQYILYLLSTLITI